MDYTESHTLLDGEAPEMTHGGFSPLADVPQERRPIMVPQRLDQAVARERVDRWLEKRRTTRTVPEFGLAHAAITYAELMDEKRR